MDSDNILSILASLGQGAQPAPQANVLQSVAPQAMAAPQPSPAAEIYQAATEASPPTPKPRRSLLDTIGRISDVIAKVGGADPLYQSTLDAAAKRITDAQDHALTVDASTIANATSKFKLGDLQNARRAQFARGLIALRDSGSGGNDVSQALPILGQQMGFTPQELQAFQQEVAANPNALDAMATSGLDPTKAQDSKYLGITQVIRNKETGAIQVLQPSADGSPARNLIPDGWEYVDTYKPVDLGGSTGMTGSHSATPQIIIPHTVKPDTVANNAQSNTNNMRTTGTQIEIAGMKGSAGGKKNVDPYTAYNQGMNSLKTLDQSLNDLVSDPNLEGATGLVNGHLDLTNAQRTIKGKIATLKGMGIPAAIAAITAAGGAAPRSVTEITGEVKGLVGAIENRDMPYAAYVANINAARARLRQRMQEMTQDAVRQGYAAQDKNGNIVPKSRPSASPIPSGNSSLPVLSPADVAKSPPGTRYRTFDGREGTRP